jgi:uncharacterized membrane protein YeiH
MATSRLFNSIGKKNPSIWNYSVFILFLLGSIGIGLAVAGGVINSMLYNGNYCVFTNIVYATICCNNRRIERAVVFISSIQTDQSDNIHY